MGLFCVNFHVRTSDDGALAAALDRRGAKDRHVFPPQGGWTSLFERQASDQDDERIHEIAGGLSRDLDAAVIAFLVHDSDIACYWLFDKGELLDEYNSCPDYFDGDADDLAGPSGGRTDVLVRYCRPGVQEQDLAAILAERTIFAEEVICRLADALGIEQERAISDYRDLAEEGGGLGGMNEWDDEDDGAAGTMLSSALGSQLSGMFGGEASAQPANPQATALVQAASSGDVEEIDRLLAAGVAVDAEGEGELSYGPLTGGMHQLLPGGVPKVRMTPLLAAVANKRRAAVQRLLEGGADLNRVHPLFGGPLHVAAAAGEAELLQLLIDRGGDVNQPNSQRQTPLQVIASSRASLDRLAQAQSLMKTMGVKLPGIFEQLSNVTLPVEGWDACERVLKSHGGR